MPLKRPLFALGFRPFYLLAAAFAVMAILLWLGAYSGRLTFGGGLPGVTWHGHEMVFGFLAAVIAGFLLTAVRNWTGLPTPAGALLAAMAVLWLLPRVLVFTGPALPAIVIDSAFLPVVTGAIAVPIFRSRNRRNYKIVLLLLLLSLLHVAYHAALAGRLPAALSRASLFAAVDVVAILLALVGGRVIPAFTRNAVAGSNARSVLWVDAIAFGSLVLIAGLTLAGKPTAYPDYLAASLFAIAALGHLLRLVLWQPQLTARNPLLWMLPVAYAWLPAALFLRALAAAAIVVPGAWLHALAAGALSGMMMAMMMRSSLGHTGRPLAASHSDVAAFLLLQLAALLRVLAGIAGDYRAMVLAAGALWALAFATLLLRYLPMWVSPRVDGKPG